MRDVPFLRVRLRNGVPEVSGSAAQRIGQVSLPEPLRTGQEIFGEWHWDGTEVVVRNCRLGFFPLYYYATPDEFAVSASIDRLVAAGAPTQLDEAAVATFLRLGWLVGEDTVFRAIRMLPPGGTVGWAGGSAHVSGGYPDSRPQHLSRGAAIEAFGELFREAVRKRVSRDVPFAMPLSGGRDSRHILLEADALGCRPNACYTTHDFPPYREGNIRIAAMLCERLDLDHRIIGQPGSRLAAEMTKNRHTDYGAIEHAWAIGFYRSIARSETVVYDGLAGDTLSAGHYLEPEQVELFEQGRTRTLAEKLVDGWSWRTGEQVLERILVKEAYRRFERALAVERVAKELERHAAAVNPLGSFNFWNRTRRCGGLLPFAILDRAGIAAVTPYLDFDLVEFLLGLPAEMLISKAFHTETIHRMHPRFRDIPFDDDQMSPPIDSACHHRRLLVEASAYVAYRGTGTLVARPATARRLLSLAVARGKDVRRRMSWIAPFQVAYLTQLEALQSAACTA